MLVFSWLALPVNSGRLFCWAEDLKTAEAHPFVHHVHFFYLRTLFYCCFSPQLCP